MIDRRGGKLGELLEAPQQVAEVQVQVQAVEGERLWPYALCGKTRASAEEAKERAKARKRRRRRRERGRGCS